MSSNQADKDQLGGCCGAVQTTVEDRIFNAAALGRALGGQENPFGFSQVIVHLKQANEDFWVNLSRHEERDQPLSAQHLFEPCFDGKPINVARGSEGCCGFRDGNPSLSNSVDCALMQSFVRGLLAELNAPLLKECGAKRDTYCQGGTNGAYGIPIKQVCEFRPPVPPRRKPVWNHLYLPQVARTVAIGLPA